MSMSSLFDVLQAFFRLQEEKKTGLKVFEVVVWCVEVSWMSGWEGRNSVALTGVPVIFVT